MTKIQGVETAELEPSFPSREALNRGALAGLLLLIEAMPRTDRGFSWERCDRQGNEAIRAYNENARVLKFILDNTDRLAGDLRAALYATTAEVE